MKKRLLRPKPAKQLPVNSLDAVTICLQKYSHGLLHNSCYSHGHSTSY
ncbi:hypothetical protein OIU79_003265 [Salix purpurea]|uniref:Uncharacterized protein n=1 Tax=Salix purpurea TaxID=77065 RepID=A0A9Q0UL35_SALPP|nr:hypothetical protein OIU79_003265 [Salix purpurea]